VAARVDPADEVGAAFPNVRGRGSQARRDLVIDRHRELVSVWRARMWIEREVDPRIDDGHQAREPGGRRVIRHRRGRSSALRNRIEFSGEHALIEPPVARAQQRVGAPIELRGESQARRYHVMCVNCADPGNRRVGFPSVSADNRQIGIDRATVIEPDAGVHGDPTPDVERVAGKCRWRYEHAARDRGRPEDRLKGRRIAVDEPHASWEDRQKTMLAAFDLRADFEFVICAEPA